MIDIWNAALMEIGCRIVAAPDEHTAEAMICAQFYSRARLETLRSFPWSFAAVRWQLSPKPMPEAWRGAWKACWRPIGLMP
ncbi:MAG: hypothetical protein PUB69_00390 [Desulfovibrionaceae bacterium]|nr:hypothetical protein [Desulfovibrionaceae bacterium]